MGSVDFGGVSREGEWVNYLRKFYIGLCSVPPVGVGNFGLAGFRENFDGILIGNRKWDPISDGFGRGFGGYWSVWEGDAPLMMDVQMGGVCLPPLI